jgi:VanZ family protein
MLSVVLSPAPWIRALAALTLAGVAVALFWQGAQPHAVGLLSPPWDTLAHGVVFGGFAALAWIALGGRRPVADRLAPLIALAIGIADEWAQSRLPGRFAGLDDLLADALGAVLAVAILALLRERGRGRVDR